MRVEGDEQLGGGDLEVAGGGEEGLEQGAALRSGVESPASTTFVHNSTCRWAGLTDGRAARLSPPQGRPHCLVAPIGRAQSN